MMRTRPARRSSACRSSPAPTRRRSKACSSTSRRRPSTTSSRTACGRRRFTMDGASICRPSSKLELEYRFPAYTGLRAAQGRPRRRRRRDPRHRSPPARSRRRWRRPAGRVLLNENDVGAADRSKPTARSPAASRSSAQGFYRIELDGPHGEKVDASPQYTIDVLDDQPPIGARSPSRDATRRRARSKKSSPR